MSQNVALDIKNNSFPCEGSKAVVQNLDFSQASSYLIDLVAFVMQGHISEVQSVFVDNSNSSYPLSIVNDVINQTIIVPPKSQAYLAVLNGTPRFTVKSNYVGVITIQLLNIPVTSCVWSTLGGGTTTVSNDFIVVSPLNPFPTVPSFSVVNNGSFSVSATATNTNSAMVVSNYHRVYNAGPNAVRVRYGTTAQTAATNDFVIEPNSAINLNTGTASNIAFICAATETANVFVSSFN